MVEYNEHMSCQELKVVRFVLFGGGDWELKFVFQSNEFQSIVLR